MRLNRIFYPIISVALIHCIGATPSLGQEMNVQLQGYDQGATAFPSQVKGTIELLGGNRLMKGNVRIYLNGVLSCELKAKLKGTQKASFESKAIEFSNTVKKDECEAVVLAGGRVTEVVAHTTATVRNNSAQVKKLEHEASFTVDISGTQDPNLTPCSHPSLKTPILITNGSVDIVSKSLNFVSMANKTTAADLAMTARNIGANSDRFSLPYLGIAVNNVFLKKDLIRDLTFFERIPLGIIQDARVDPFIGLNKGPAGRQRVYIRRLPSSLLHESLSSALVQPALAANSLINIDESHVCYNSVVAPPIQLPLKRQ